MGIERQAQIAQRAIFPLNRFDDLLVEVAPAFLPSSASLSRVDVLARAGNQVALFVIDAGIENAAVLRELASTAAYPLLVRRFATHHGATFSVTCWPACGPALQAADCVAVDVLAEPRCPCISATSSARQIRTITARCSRNFSFARAIFHL
jgi:hypothetical protein